MQLLRDNLTLWTSSEGAEGEAPKEEKPEEETAAAATTTTTTEEPKPEESKPAEAES